MKLPSLDHIYQKATITLRRFPFTMFAAAIATGILIDVIQVSGGDQPVLLKIAMCGILGIAFFTAISLFAEKKNGQGTYWWITHAAGLGLLIAYYFTLPGNLDGPHYIDIYRYGLFILGMHLLVSIAPYWGESGQMSFWQYNKLLFLRFLTALLFSAVLYAGLSVALLSIHVLLGLDIDYKVYLYLATFMGIIFNTWFFLAGIPTSLQVFEKRTSYPKGLKIFTQNVLLPLVVVYVIILYLYMIKIIAQWSWPEGWVAILVLSFSIVGILAILLLYPIRHKAENKWIDRFYTGYFAALVPLVILLLLAIYRRVADYGITINRYFVIILALWLTSVVMYFLISKSQNIKIVPSSLCILAFVISFGPWGAFSVSRHSQLNRLEFFLKQNDILKDGKIHKSSSKIPNQDRDEIVSIVRYLNNMSDLEAIQPWFDKSLTKMRVTNESKDSVKTISYYQRPKRALNLMGIDYYGVNANGKISAGGANNNETAIGNYVFADQKNVFSVENFDWFIRGLRWPNNGVLKETYIINHREVMIESPEGTAKLYIYYKNAKQKALSVNMDDIVKKLRKRVSNDQHQLPVKELTFPLSNDYFRANLYFEQFHWDSTKQFSGTFSLALK